MTVLQIQILVGVMADVFVYTAQNLRTHYIHACCNFLEFIVYSQ